MAYDVDLQVLPARPIAAVRFHGTPADIANRIGDAFATVFHYLGAHGIESPGPVVAYYQPAFDGFDVLAGAVVTTPVPGDATVVAAELPAGEVAHTTHIGPYDTLPAAYRALRDRAEVLGRPVDPDGPMWEEYWSPPGTPPEQTRTEIYWPVVA